MATTIDVWDVETYDAELLAELSCEAELICQYVWQDKENYRLRELEERRGPPAKNPFSYSFLWFAEHVIMPLMNERNIRGWHYTRLLDEEADVIRREGVYPSTLARIKQRLDALETVGVLSPDQAEALYAGSPFHHNEQVGARSNQFWMTAFPMPINNSGVAPLLGSWGGESVYFWQKDQALKDNLKRIGKARVVELAVPLRSTKHSYSAAKAVLAHYGRSIGCEPDGADFEFYATQPLGPEAVLSIHTEGESDYLALARGYPGRFSCNSSAA